MAKLRFFIFVFFLQTAEAQVYQDQPFIQDFSIQFPLENTAMKKVLADRNRTIQVLGNHQLFAPSKDQLKPYHAYGFLREAAILDMEIFKGNYFYLIDKTVFSPSYGGRFQWTHGLDNINQFIILPDTTLLLWGKNSLHFFNPKKSEYTPIPVDGEVIQGVLDEEKHRLLILSSQGLWAWNFSPKKLNKILDIQGIRTLAVGDNSIYLGTSEGLMILDDQGKIKKQDRLPWTEITHLKMIRGQLWAGTTKGAFSFRPDGKFNYYASRRWLIDDEVVDMAEGPDGSVLVLSTKGLSQLKFEKTTLEEKANYFQKIQRERHIRYGLESSVILEKPGDLASFVLKDTDNDGLWTSVYLAGELFRYGASQSLEAKENALEAFVAMERLTEISGIQGFPARTFEKSGFQWSDWHPKDTTGIWQKGPMDWTWKSTTSSDESCGHFFVYALFAEIIEEPYWKNRAIDLIRKQMDHIIKNDWYLISWDGKPTRWGRWNPAYVNSFPISSGDRRLNSTLILAFLQTTYHFTQEPKYKKLAEELMEKHGYEENACRPASVIGYIEGEPLSDGWNHSDDEMYFLTAPAFVRYAFTEEQRKMHLKAVESHWEIERDEKNPLWNFLTKLSGAEQIDLPESIWWLKEYPLDLIDWKIDNSHRKDLNPVPPNFRKKDYSEVLPRDERPHHLHNREYVNQGGSGGTTEYSPYVFLLPYWAGRYLGMIQ